jgi:hypothetical protein
MGTCEAVTAAAAEAANDGEGGGTLAGVEAFVGVRLRNEAFLLAAGRRGGALPAVAVAAAAEEEEEEEEEEAGGSCAPPSPCEKRRMRLRT